MDLESWVKKRGDMLGAEAGHLNQHFVLKMKTSSSNKAKNLHPGLTIYLFSTNKTFIENAYSGFFLKCYHCHDEWEPALRTVIVSFDPGSKAGDVEDMAARQAAHLSFSFLFVSRIFASSSSTLGFIFKFLLQRSLLVEGTQNRCWGHICQDYYYYEKEGSWNRSWWKATFHPLFLAAETFTIFCWYYWMLLSSKKPLGLNSIKCIVKYIYRKWTFHGWLNTLCCGRHWRISRLRKRQGARPSVWSLTTLLHIIGSL